MHAETTDDNTQVTFTLSKREMAKTNVRILRDDPNSINKSSQFVSTVTVRQETALVFEKFRKGRISKEEALDEIDKLSVGNQITVPFSVYVNVHDAHASVFFIQSDIANRANSSDLEETRKLGQMNRGLRVFFNENSFQIINDVRIQRIDLFTENGNEYKIGLSEAVLKPRIYKMFKCYEVIGISGYDIEWAYLMASQDWYDTAANNCLTYSKRFVNELHRHVMDEDLNTEELKNLNKLYISIPGESSLEKFRSRVSFFLAPSMQPFAAVIFVVLLVAAYIEIRIRYFS